MNHNWYAVITADVLMNRSLTDKQKLLVALISNLSNEKGYAFSSNKYLADCLCCSEVTVRQNISILEEKGYLGRVIKLNEKNEIEYRSLTVLERPTPPMANNHTPDEIQSLPPDDKSSHNNKLYNNKEYILRTFEKFWQLYPIKKDKKKAEQKWNRLSKVDIEKVFSTFNQFLDDKPFPTYTYPFPTTFLNARKWENYEEEKIDLFNEKKSEVNIGDLYAEARGWK